MRTYKHLTKTKRLQLESLLKAKIPVKEIAKREKDLSIAMRTMLGIGPKVHLVPAKSIARSEGKAVRVVDKRKLHD